MAYAQELKNLVAEIKTGHRDRRAKISGIKRETRDILGAVDDYMKQVAAELREMARNLKEFLAKSEATRKRTFEAMMGDIKTDIGVIRRSVTILLDNYKGERKEAGRHWASLGGRRAPAEEEVSAPKIEEKKKGKK